jgi:hypothetical protein
MDNEELEKLLAPGIIGVRMSAVSIGFLYDILTMHRRTVAFLNAFTSR